MPIYEFCCDECQHRFETIVLSAREKVKCPSCDGAVLTKQVSVFSAPSARAEPSAGGSCGCTPQTCGCH